MTVLAVLFISAQTFAASNVLIEHVTHVGFAPPENVGTYSQQILVDGTVQSVDNKNKVVKIAKLSSVALKNLKSEIASLKVEALEGEDGPECEDAPSSETVVYRNAKKIEIKTQEQCRTKEMYSASTLNQVMDGASSLSSALSR